MSYADSLLIRGFFESEKVKKRNISNRKMSKGEADKQLVSVLNNQTKRKVQGENRLKVNQKAYYYDRALIQQLRKNEGREQVRADDTLAKQANRLGALKNDYSEKMVISYLALMCRACGQLKPKPHKTGYQRPISNNQLMQSLYRLPVPKQINQWKIDDYYLASSLRSLAKTSTPNTKTKQAHSRF